MCDTHPIQVDTRVSTASNRDLMEEVEAERFREDLYWRLNVVPIVIPPLRQRREDVPDLVHHFLSFYSEANDRYVVHVAGDAMEAMQDYHWPGNVRELQNYVERAVVMADGDELTVDLLPDVVRGKSMRRSSSFRAADVETLVYEFVQQTISSSGEDEENLHGKIVGRVEKEVIAQTMLECNSVQTKAATRLGINRNTLHKKLKEYGLENGDKDE